MAEIDGKFRHEVIMWKGLSDPSAILLIGAYTHSSKLVMVLERANGGNINQRRGT